jgi:putative tricarboxylic transport membrane protein
LLEALSSAAQQLFQFDVFLILIGGCIIGLVFGSLPGLSGLIAVAVLLPFTFGWEPMTAIYLFIAIIGSSTFGGSIPAVLINTPGTPINAATCLDGYPMAVKGEASRALGAASAASGFGAVFGVLVLLALIPVLKPIVLLFAAPEFLMIILLGIVSIAFVAKGNMLKGLISGGLGILISMIGFSPSFGILRFNFGSEYLWDGITLIPFLVGIFAIAELINYTLKGGTIAKGEVKGTLKGTLTGVADVWRYKYAFFKSSAIGTIIGIIPGVGGTVANFLGYTVCRQTSKHPELFGTGYVEGVVASESSNNSKDGGALVPALAFGIPGNPATALLLGAFVLHGLVPGPSFLNEFLHIAFVLILGLVIANIFTSVFGVLMANYLTKVTTVKVEYLVPIILMLVFSGTFVYRGNIFDPIITICAGIFGFAMNRFGFSVICLVIGYILGIMAERNFHTSIQISQGDPSIFITRPITVVLLVLVILVLCLPVISKVWKKKKVLDSNLIKGSDEDDEGLS